MSTPPQTPFYETTRALLISHNRADSEAIRIALSKPDWPVFEITRSDTLGDALVWSAEIGFDVILFDLSVPDSAGPESVRSLLEASPTAAVVCLGDRDDEQLENEMFRFGARGYVNKSELASGQFVRTIRQAIEHARIDLERVRLERGVLLSQKIESLGRIAGGIAHDFNDLIVSILGNTELALLDLPRQSPLRTYLLEVQSAGQQVAELTHKLDIYAGKCRYNFEVIHVSRIVCDMSRPLRATTAQQPILIYETSGETEATAWIAADIFQMRQAILSLLTNAAEALPAESGVITIRTGVRRYSEDDLRSDYLIGGRSAGDYAYIEVRDKGCGIAPEAIDQIFDPFFSTKGSGRGLGLTTALGIIRSHRGTLRVDCSKERGTSIRILIPCINSARPPRFRRRVESEQLPLEVAMRRRRDPSADSPSRKTILILDTDEEIRKLTRAMLTRAGFGVHDTDSAVAAFEQIAACEPSIDAVVFGTGFDTESAGEMLSRLRTIRPNLPVVFCGSPARVEQLCDVDWTSDHPHVTMVRRPFRHAELTKKLNQALSRGAVPSRPSPSFTVTKDRSG
jgi:signal transduction histidine kinase